ncbi:MAG: hypothetical protein ABJA70_04210 [Chryseolinea sp.]
MNRPEQTKRVIAIAIVISLTIHIMLACTALLFPLASRSNRLLTVYQRYVLSGPYFTDETVRTSHHLYVGYKSGGKWAGKKDYAQQDFEDYCKAPWRYGKLHLRRYPLYLARRLAQHDQPGEGLCTSPSLMALRKFSEGQWIGQRVDSISFLYSTRTYDVQSSSYSIDTIFSVKCNAR